MESGMTTPRTGSSQPRSSAQAAKRLKGKDSWWDDELRRCLSKYIYDRESSDDEPPSPEYDKIQDMDIEDVEVHIKSSFGSRKRRRRRAFLLCHRTTDKRIVSVPVWCIRPGIPSIVLYVNFYEIMWVGVHGIDTICVVTRNEDVVRVVGQTAGAWCPAQPDRPNLDDFPKYSLLSFWNALISKVEDMADEYGESRQMSNKSSEEPFSVAVCYESGSSGSSESSDEPCQMFDKSIALIGGSAHHDGKEKAMEFLLQEMESDSAFTFDKTIQTAIAAFQHLFCQKFKPEELRAFVLKNDISLGWELRQVRERVAIEEVIPFINEA